MNLPAIRKPEKVPVGCLRLDHQNPRLTGRTHHRSEEGLIAELYRSAELDELLQSMSSNGYLDIEPLWTTRNPSSKGRIPTSSGSARCSLSRKRFMNSGFPGILIAHMK